MIVKEKEKRVQVSINLLLMKVKDLINRKIKFPKRKAQLLKCNQTIKERREAIKVRKTVKSLKIQNLNLK